MPDTVLTEEQVRERLATRLPTRWMPLVTPDEIIGNALYYPKMLELFGVRFDGSHYREVEDATT